MSELKEYESQLELVNQGLLDAPDDESLIELKSELTDLISMIKQAESTHQSPVRSPNVVSEIEDDLEKKDVKDEIPHTIEYQNTGVPMTGVNPRPKFEVGQHVMVLDSSTKQFKPAKINLIAGSSFDPSYTIRFQKSSSVLTVKEHQIKDLPKKSAGRKPGSSTSSNTNGAPKVSHLPSKAKLLDDSKNKWQKFNKKFSRKKGSSEVLGALGGGVSKSQPKKGLANSGFVELPEKGSKPSRSVFNSSTRIG